ncbi:unnamed protein product [Moneuplotes crassus]|uniref:Myb-like DNA-binding domain containing protein n=1 Tax=Euplotes crassus TaxID=5936 RepID=A0AAD1YBS6_EUPCR|nr:unnamed protein product [Moneuplotes crassus]
MTFTEEEDHKLIQLVEQYGKKWLQISKYFQNKNHEQLKHRYRNIDPTVRRGKWDPKEDSELIEAIFYGVEDRIVNLDYTFADRARRDIILRIRAIHNVCVKNFLPKGEQKGKLNTKIGSSRRLKHTRKRVVKRESKAESPDRSTESSCRSIVKTENTVIKQEFHPGVNSEQMKSNTSGYLLKEETKDDNWTTSEIQQIFTLHQALGEKWEEIKPFITNRTSEEIRYKFYEILQLTACEYKKDVDQSKGLLSDKFPNKSTLYLEDPLNCPQNNLLIFIEMAEYLLNNNSNILTRPSVEDLQNFLKEETKDSFPQPQPPEDQSSKPKRKGAPKTAELTKMISGFSWSKNTCESDEDSSSDNDSYISLVINENSKNLEKASELGTL